MRSAGNISPVTVQKTVLNCGWNEIAVMRTDERAIR